MTARRTPSPGSATASRTSSKARRASAWAASSSSAAMSLMGRYAAANHALIHRHIARKLGTDVILDIENHHNFAWKETHEVGGEERKVIIASQGRDARGCRRSRDHPRLDGVARLRRARQGFARVAALGVARRGARDEPH